LTTAPSPVFLSRIQEELAISPAVLRGLEKKRILSFTRKSIRRDPFQSLPEFSVAPRPVLTEEQKVALAELWDAAGRGGFSPALLHGVTGSGKTEVYLTLIERMLEAKKRGLLLMPEIGLTPRVAWEFRERLGDQVAILHSGLADGERLDEWWRIKRGEVGVVIGTRSAVFAPLDNLKLIVVDEEHDPSYKQQEAPRYQGRDCALMRGKLNEALVVLGSATPSIESCYNARNGKYRYVRLNSRVQDRPLPKVRLVDMREDFRQSEKKSVLSSELGKAIADRLERQEQVLVLLNRRGYSASVLCRSCGQTLPCRYCSIPLSYHKKRGQLLCHYCDYRMSLPKACPQCGSEYLYLVGEGTEKIEVLLEKDHPAARIERLDRDVAQRKNARGDILSRFQKREIDILVGTQMISKGHDFPQVTLAGILSADISLSFPDFRCAERTFQLLTQMAGRPGRGELVGEVLIQTFYPDHYCLKFVQQHDYDGFYEKELRFRRMMHYPPFSSLAMIQVTSKNLEEAGGTIQQLGKWLEGKAGKDFRILGPSPAPLARLKAEHRFQIILKASSRAKLHNLVRTCLEHAGTQGLDLRKIHIDIDPVNLL
jgi:primosomal protein N' (replication factor Y)